MVTTWQEISFIWDCSSVLAIWKAQNKACFAKTIIKDPMQTIYHICAVMKYWTSLYCEADMEQLEDGVNTMLQIANQPDPEASEEGCRDVKIAARWGFRWTGRCFHLKSSEVLLINLKISFLEAFLLLAGCVIVGSVARCSFSLLLNSLSVAF